VVKRRLLDILLIQQRERVRGHLLYIEQESGKGRSIQWFSVDILFIPQRERVNAAICSYIANKREG
jgi:hypothetical protein